MQSAHVNFGIILNNEDGPTASHAFFACAKSMKGAYSLEKRCGVVGIKSVRVCNIGSFIKDRLWADNMVDRCAFSIVSFN